MSHNEHTQTLHDIKNHYINTSDLISDQILTDLQVFVSQYQDKIDNIVKTEKTLKIGIVGEVKAGKSSFLNALLFKGQRILPEAPTPMTAALTKICHGDAFRAQVHFYSRKDWETIESLSNHFDLEYEKLREEYVQRKKGSGSLNPFSSLKRDMETATKEKQPKVSEEEIQRYVSERISKEKKGCKELTNFVKDYGIDVDQYLDSTKDIEGVQSLDELVDTLGYYVGANGVLTPIVKSTNIELAMPELKDLEVIDTPGTNDPIVSRGMVTRKYLSQCDAIFLLSYTGQFMKSQDVEFIVNTLPFEGIRKGIIVGSKFDSALLSAKKPGGSLVQELRDLQSKLTQHANQVIDGELRKNPDNQTLLSLKSYLPPQFISSLAYSIGVKEGKDLTELEAHIVDRLQTTFPKQEFNAELFMELSNIERIKHKEFQGLIDEKEEILSHKLQDTIDGQMARMREILELMKSHAISKSEQLIHSDKKDMEESYKSIIHTLNNSKSDIEYIFDNEIINIKRKITELQHELREARRNYASLDVNTSQKEEWSGTKRHGFLWLQKSDVYQNVTYNYAKVNQVIDNVRNFAVDIQGGVLDSFNQIVDSKDLRKHLKQAILDLFDLKDGNFSEKELLNPIESLLNKLTIPSIQIDSFKYEKMISEAFSSSVVEDDDIHNLVQKQNEVLSLIMQDVIQLLEEEKQSIEATLTTESNTFITKVSNNIEEDIATIKKQLDERDVYIKKYQDLLQVIETDIKQIS